MFVRFFGHIIDIDFRPFCTWGFLPFKLVVAALPFPWIWERNYVTMEDLGALGTPENLAPVDW